MLVTTRVLAAGVFCARPAAKNQSLSLKIGPPSVASKVGTISSLRGSPATLVFSKGVKARHRSLVKVVRKEPLKSLPPDLVIALTVPPPKRPYSAEMFDVHVLVSSIASSMKRDRGWPRSVLLTTTPSTRYRLSKAMAPEVVGPPPPPVEVVPGARRTAPRRSRPTGSLSIVSAL